MCVKGELWAMGPQSQLEPYPPSSTLESCSASSDQQRPGQRGPSILLLVAALPLLLPPCESASPDGHGQRRVRKQVLLGLPRWSGFPEQGSAGHAGPRLLHTLAGLGNTQHYQPGVPALPSSILISKMDYRQKRTGPLRSIPAGTCGP